MKKNIIILVLIMLGALFVNSDLYAQHETESDKGVLSEGLQEQPIESVSSGQILLASYKTWKVVEVTDDTIILQRTTRNGKLVEKAIARDRRPYLELGDRVRYDGIRNRLRKTLDK
jgi:hypothetical protein